MIQTRKKLRSYRKNCRDCFKSVFMYELSYGTWICVDDSSRLLRHYCIRSGGFQ